MGQAVSDHNTKMITLTELRITKSLLSIHIHTWRVLLKLHKCDNIIWLIILSLLTLRAQTVQGILHLHIIVKMFLFFTLNHRKSTRTFGTFLIYPCHRGIEKFFRSFDVLNPSTKFFGNLNKYWLCQIRKRPSD
jgi:hypothetical protein